MPAALTLRWAADAPPAAQPCVGLGWAADAPDGTPCRALAWAADAPAGTPCRRLRWVADRADLGCCPPASALTGTLALVE